MSDTAGPSTLLLDEIVAHKAAKGKGERPQALLTRLVEAFERDEQSLMRKDSRVSDTIFDNTFALFDFLVPLISTYPDAELLQAPAKLCLASAARWSSPREILMAVEVQLRALRPKVSVWAGSGPDSDDKLDNSPSRYAALLEASATAISRIALPQRLKFAESFADNARVAIGRLAEECMFRSYSERQEAEKQLLINDVASQTQLAVDAIARSLDAQPGSETETEVQAAQKALRFLLLETIATLHRELGCTLSSTIYATKGIGPKEPYSTDCTQNRELWDRILSTLEVLETSPFLLMSLSVKQNKPALFVGAFVALVHLIASNPEKVDPDELGLEGRALFMHAIVMRVTAMRQDESYKVGEDEQLYWCYWALDGFLREADETSSARYALMDILNWVNPLAANSPDPTARFLAFRLIARALLYDTDSHLLRRDEKLQQDLLTELVVECPEDALRTAAVGLVKELILLKQREEAIGESIFLSEAFLETTLGRSLLSPTWARLSPLDKIRARTSEKPVEPVLPSCREFLRSEVSGTMERLSLAFVLLKHAQTRRTSSSDPPLVCTLARRNLLEPIAAAFAAWRSSSEKLNARERLELELVEDLLQRVQQVADELAQ